MTGGAATLVDDGGAAAAEEGHFFRSPQFLRAEAATHSDRGEGTMHSLVVEGPSRIALPVIVREIPGGGGRDAISPYGYPGGRSAGATPPDPADVDWSATGLVSAFVRDRVGDPPAFEGGTERAQVQIAEPAQPSGVRKRLREQIRRNERRGWRIGVEPGTEAAPEDRAAFERAYAETMARTGAADRYLYDGAYFEELLGATGAWLVLAGREGEPPSAGAIAAVSDGHLHYYLGGTADAALDDSPMKNLFASMTSLAGELGLALNLGGGIAPGDSLDRFKQGFANGTAPFRTHEIVCDAEAYEELSAGSPRVEGFFPRYRAPEAG